MGVAGKLEAASKSRQWSGVDFGQWQRRQVRVELMDSLGATQESTTDSDGRYVFPGLPIDDYVLSVRDLSLPAGPLLGPIDGFTSA